MGKKQPLAPATKQRAGADITRFLERRGGQDKFGGLHGGASADGHVAGVRAPYGRAPTPGKHLLDNVLLSQDVDDGGMQVVWASSPTAVYSPQKGANASQDAASVSQPADNSQASKDGFRKSLIQAVQRMASDAEAHNGQAEHPVGDLNSGDEVAEQLLARRNSNRETSTSGPDSRGHEAQQQGRARACPPKPSAVAAPAQVPASAPAGAVAGTADDDADAVMQDVLGAAEAYKTPSAARPAGLARLAGANRSAECLRPPSSGLTAGKRPLLASSKKAASGNKRRALLDLLDQVELMVKRGPTQTQAPTRQEAADASVASPPGGPEAESPAAGNARPSAGAAAATMGPAPTQGPAGTPTLTAALQSLDAPPPSSAPCGLAVGGTAAPTQPSLAAPSARPAVQPTAGELSGSGSAPTRGPGSTMPPPPSRQAQAHASTPLRAGITGPAAVPGANMAQGPTATLERCASNSGRCSGPVQAPALDTRASASTNTPALGSAAAASASAGPPRGVAGTAVGSYPPASSHSTAAAAAAANTVPAATSLAASAAGVVAAVAATASATPATCNAAEPQPIVLRPNITQAAPVAMDDDDDDDWGDIDVDALVASATAKQASQPQPGASAATATLAACPGPDTAPQPHLTAVAVGPPFNPLQQQPYQQNQQQLWQPAPQSGRPPLAPQPPLPPQPQPLQHHAESAASQVQPPWPRPPPQQLHQQPGPEMGHATAGLAAAVAAAPSPAPAPGPGLLGDREDVHFVVLEVEEVHSGHFKVLRCFNEYKGREVRVYLRDMWADQAVQAGDAVNVVGGRLLPDNGGLCEGIELSAKEGLLVLHPDVLLSGTTICDALRCPRQAWLNQRVASGPSGPGGEKMLFGSMMHMLLQEGLRAAMAGRLDKGELMAQARSILSSNTAALLETRQDEASVLAALSQHLDTVLSWCHTYVNPNTNLNTESSVSSRGPAASQLGGRIETTGGGDAPTFCRVSEVLDIEESIWAPKYGLKGQLDASLRVTLSVKDPLHNQRTLTGGFASTQQQQQRMMPQQGQGAMQQGQGQGQGEPARFHGAHGRVSDGGLGGRGWQQQQGQQQAHGPPRRQHSWSVGTGTGTGTGTGLLGGQPQQEAMPGVASETVVVPFEFKTGKDRHENRAQVLLYLLLMEDRYQAAVRTGLLWNVNKPIMQAVRYAHHELVSLIMHRNRLAAFLAGGPGGPPPQPPPPLLGPESERKCNYCSAASTCALYLAASTHGDGGGAAVAADGGGGGGGASQLAEMDLHDEVRQRLSGIAPSAAAFFAHWRRLVDLEEHAARANHADMWAISGPQREQQGGCVSQLLLERELPPHDGPDGRRYLYVFKRTPHAAATAAAAAAQPLDSSAPLAPPGAATAALAGRHAAGAAGKCAEGRGREVEGEPGSEGGGGLLSAGFAPGDLGVLGVEGRHAAVARVSVESVTRDTITLSCRKEIKVARLAAPPPQSPHQNHSACRCGRAETDTLPGCSGGTRTTGSDSSSGACTCCASGSSAAVPRVTWRLDREESASHFAQMRLNLSLVCGPGVVSASQHGGGGRGGRGGGGGGGVDASQVRREENLAQLRRLVVDLQAPQQGLAASGAGAGSQLSGSLASSQLSCSSSYLRVHAAEMNGEQLEAVQRVLAMQDYAILLGMPGTGKTTTIVHVIRALVEARVSVLVASYTNSAVDNILLKLVGSPVSFVRLGSAASVHPGVRPYMPGGQAHPDTSVAGLQELMARVHVVGTTCLSVHTPLLAGRTFGVCILDEASQVTLPASLGALGLARSFLLVGDHYQLSPLVVSREAAQGGLGVSLFRRLSEAHPQAVVTLRSQYRMAADIMALSNALVYNGRMLCGDERVANAVLHLPGLQALTTHGSAPPRQHSPRAAAGPCGPACGPWPAGLPVPDWLLRALQPQVRVLLLDTDSVVGCREQVLQDGIVNPGEVRLVHALACALVAAGLAPRDIGVASPYKAQVAALQQALAGLAPAAAPAAASPPPGGAAVEVLTVDKYQGRDKPAILLSLVRCNAGRGAGRLLADWQRLNVAITRARTKLLLVGSAATLGSIPLLAEMLALLRGRGWVAALPVDCLAALPPVPVQVGAAAGAAAPAVEAAPMQQ